jgi:hypothetical protein
MAGFNRWTVGESDLRNITPLKARGLIRVVDILGRKAMVWGTPQDIIEHHKQEIGKVLGSLS